MRVYIHACNFPSLYAARRKFSSRGEFWASIDLLIVSLLDGVFVNLVKYMQTNRNKKMEHLN